MALLPILKYPDPRLHTRAVPVQSVDHRIQTLVSDMLQTMYEASGIGLAATQVDVHECVIVMDTSESRDQPVVLINPEITERSEEIVLGEEGCLSVPAVYDKVERHARITVRALNRDGQPFELEAEGMPAVCVQHEMDHLRGKVFVEYLSPLKRDRIRTKMLKRSREEQRR
ncbi:MAG: peptide deformylase [Rubrivivax sp.]|jgi:peptide deformylase|nr:peptide deformylase [Rubrivivax sp.]